MAILKSRWFCMRVAFWFCVGGFEPLIAGTAAPQHLSPESMLSSGAPLDGSLELKLTMLLRAIEKNHLHSESFVRPVAELAREVFQGDVLDWLGEERVGQKLFYRFKVRSVLLKISFDMDAQNARLESAQGIELASLDSAMSEWVDLKREFLLSEELGEQEIVTDFGARGRLIGSLLGAQQRLEAMRREEDDGGFGHKLGLMTLSLKVRGLSLMARYPNWVTTFAVLGVGMAWDAIFGVDQKLHLPFMVCSVTTENPEDKYLALPQEQLRKMLETSNTKLQALQQELARTQRDIANIRDILRRYLGREYRDKDAQRKRQERLQRIMAELRARPLPWAVADDLLPRAEVQDMNKGLYDQWDRLEKTQKNIELQIGQVSGTIYLTQAKMEIYSLNLEILGLKEQRAKAADLLQRATKYLQGLGPPQKTNFKNMNDHIIRKGVKNKEVEVWNCDQRILLADNAIKAALFYLEADPELLAKVHRTDMLRYYKDHKNKLPYADELSRHLVHFKTKGSPIGVNPEFSYNADFKAHWAVFLRQCEGLGIHVTQGREKSLELRWDKLPNRVLSLNIVSARALPSLARTDVEAGSIRESIAAFTSGVLAAEVLQQELDNFAVNPKENVAALARRILQSLERISKLNSFDRQAFIEIMDGKNHNGIDTLGFKDLLEYYREHDGTVDVELLDMILTYIEKASNIYPLESGALRPSTEVECAM